MQNNMPFDPYITILFGNHESNWKSHLKYQGSSRWVTKSGRIRILEAIKRALERPVPDAAGSRWAPVQRIEITPGSNSVIIPMAGSFNYETHQFIVEYEFIPVMDLSYMWELFIIDLIHDNLIFFTYDDISKAISIGQEMLYTRIIMDVNHNILQNSYLELSLPNCRHCK